MEASSLAMQIVTQTHTGGRALLAKLLLLLASATFALCTLAVMEIEFDVREQQFSTRVPGDFNGDGVEDALLLPHGDSGTPFVVFDYDYPFWRNEVTMYPPRGLDRALSANFFHPVVADLNGDSRSDLILQSRTQGYAVTLLASAVGTFDQLHETINHGTYGRDWSYDNTRIISGDFNGDQRDDLFLQPREITGSGLLSWADQHGDVSQSDRVQNIPDRHLGLQWSDQMVEILVGNFNGQDADGGFRDDVLLRSLDQQSEQSHALILADTHGELTVLADTWNRNDTLPWNDRNHRAIVADFDHDGRDDVLLRSERDGSGVLLISRASKFFSRSPGRILSKSEVKKHLAQNRQAREFSNHLPYSMVVTNAANTPQTDTSVSAKELPSRAMPVVNSVGVVGGSLSVDQGVAKYSIPLIIPPGRNGVQPQLALAYSHTSGNGHLGVGWQISGQSSITRCSATNATDSDFASAQLGGVTTSNKDRYCLDGQYLKVVSGNYGTTDSVYRTEVDTYLRATPSFAGASPDQFTVETQNNLTLTYGGTADSKLLAHTNNLPLEWKLNSVKDQYGNEVRYQYTVKNAVVPGYAVAKPVEHYLTQISYTHFGADSDLRYVKFNYEDGRPDQRDYYRAGNRMLMTKRLDSVQTFVNASKVREYSLHYELGTTRRSRLTHVYECAFEGRDANDNPAGTECLPPTRFEWQGDVYEGNYAATPVPIQQFYQNVGSTDDFGYDKLPVDFDGDGRVDFIDVQGDQQGGNSEVVVWLNAENGLTKLSYPLNNPSIDASVLRSGFGRIDYDANGQIDFMIPSGEITSMGRPGNISTAPINADGTVAHTTEVTIGWTTVGGSVNHYEVGRLGPSQVWDDAITVASANSQSATYTIPFNMRHNTWLFGVRACATASSSYCGTYGLGEPFFVCINGNPPDCDPIGLAPFEAQPQICAAPINPDAHLAILSFNASANNVIEVVELGNIPVNAVNFDEGAGIVAYDEDSYFAMDVNGDGRKDIVTRDVDQWYVFLRTDDLAGSVPDDQLYVWSGFCLSASLDRHARVINYDGDGRQDLLVERATAQGADLYVYRSTGTGFEVIDIGVTGGFPAYTSISNNLIEQPRITPIVADVNGDGLTDIVISRDTGSPSTAERGFVHLYLNTGDGFITDTLINAGTQTVVPSPGTIEGMRLGHYLSLTDADGDGDLDLLIPDVRVQEGYGPCITLVTGNSCNHPELVSLNDGYSWTIAYYENGTYSTPAGCTPDCALMTLRAGRNVDIDSNGRFEYIAEAVRSQPLQQTPEANPLVLDFGGSSPDLLRTVIEAQGYLNRQTDIVYEPLQSGSLSAVYQHYPIPAADGLSTDVAGTMHVVQSTHSDNGIDNLPNAVRYQYDSARFNSTGRGFAGFASVTTYDEEAGLAGKTDYHQEFPFTGLAKQSSLHTISNDQPDSVLTSASINWTANCLNSPCSSPSVRYPKTLIVQSFDPLAPAMLLAETITTIPDEINGSVNVDNFGNIKLIRHETKNSQGQLLRRVETNTNYAPVDTANIWWVNKITGQSTTFTNPQLQGAGQSFTSSVAFATYNPQRSVTSQISEPGDARHAMNLSLSYLNTGQIQARVMDETASVEAAYMAPAQRLYSEYLNAIGSAAYFASDVSTRENSTFPTRVTTSDYHGMVSEYTDPNNLSAEPTLKNVFDGFGRVVQSKSIGRQMIKTTFGWGSGIDTVCPATAAYRIVETRIDAPDSYVCFDKLERPVREGRRAYNGNYVYTDTQYDRQGRVVSVSEPDFFANSNPDGATVINNYDIAGRVTSITQPDGLVIDYTYAGLTTSETVTGHVTASRACTTKTDGGSVSCILQSSVTRNALGQVISATDTRGKISSFLYDAYGNRVSITDPNGQVIRHEFDKRNRLIKTTDPNLGTMTYEYDVLGQLLRTKHHDNNQLSGTGRTIHSVFDDQGRITKREEQYDTGLKVLTGTWVFDVPPGSNTMAVPFINRLSSVTGIGTIDNNGGVDNFEQLYNYRPNAGQLSSIETRIAHAGGTENFFKAFDYDPVNGQLQRTTYPGGFAVDHTYNSHGYLTQDTSSDTGAGANAILRNIGSRNARGQVVSRQFAPGSNGQGLITQEFGYFGETGQISDICTAIAAVCTVNSPDLLQHISQTFDALSMPSQKTDHSQHYSQIVTERDSLARLKKIDTQDLLTNSLSTVTYAYDDVGNFTDKSDWGSYSYPNINSDKPYQVSQVNHASGLITYGYDDYGNNDNVTGAGAAAVHNRSVTYTFDNKPRIITSGNVTSTFSYTPDQNRYKQVVATPGANIITTYYAGDTERIVTQQFDGTTTQITRHYVGNYLIHTNVDTAVDSDNDGLTDTMDNCQHHANPNQADSDADGFGNRCDPDYDNDNVVSFNDYILLTSAFGTLNPAVDLSGDGFINFADIAIFASLFQTQPGPGALAASFDRYLLSDELGSVNTVVNASGEIEAQYRYDAFGQRTTGDNAGVATETIGFTGHEHLEVAGLIHMTGRLYDPRLGRFTSIDPVIGNPGDSQNFSAYSYVHNRPLAFTDPSGYDINDDPYLDNIFPHEPEFRDIYQGLNQLRLLNPHHDGTGSTPDPVSGIISPVEVNQIQAAAVNPQNVEMTQVRGQVLVDADGNDTPGMTELRVRAWTGIKNIVAPNLAAVGERGEPGNGTDFYHGASKATVNLAIGAVNLSVLAMELSHLNLNRGVVGRITGYYFPSLFLPEFEIRNQQLTGAASVDIASNSIGIGLILKLSRFLRFSTVAIPPGGLNLYKWRTPKSLNGSGWKQGDYFLYLPDRHGVKRNWRQNSSRLRQEMRRERPIYDSHVDPKTGEQIGTDGFLNAERKLLENHGWRYDSRTRAYHPPSQ